MNRGIVLAGLPATGKTSYLALLFHAIVEDRADGLSLGRFDDDREYITEVSDVLLASNVADHTTIASEQDVILSLAYDDIDLTLNIPDLSGETWEHALVDRRWSQQLADAIGDATGFMVFVHCKEINDGLTIVDAEQAAAAILGGDAVSEAVRPESDDEQRETPSTDAADADVYHPSDPRSDDMEDENDENEEKHCTQLTQVSLIELIQFFSAASSPPIRLSLVISAWDLERRNLKPRQWLAKNMPMLTQFLEVNTDQVEATVWGVSAQGADLSDERVREEYKDQDPIDRARIVASDGTEAGVAAPLLWVLSLN